MRRVLCAAVAAFAVAFTVADAYSCTYNGASLAGIPVTIPPLAIPQKVPSDPSLDGPRNWQFSLCTQTPYSGCSAPSSYVVEINGNLDGCDAGFDNALTDSWTSNYGGANALFGGKYQNPNDRIANVTLICDPTATTLQPQIPTVNAHPSQGGAVWVFDIMLRSNAVCGGPVPPPPGPTPPTPPPPPGPTPPTSPPGPTPPPGPNPGPAPKKEEPKSSPVAIVFVVFVFVGPAIYIGATVAYNYFKLGKRGRELAPHPEFWKDFPRLCFDGCKFVKNKFMQLIGKGDGTGTYGGGDTESSYTKV